MSLPVVFHAKAFTLVELLLVCALVMVIGSFTFPVGFSLYQSQILTEAQDGVVRALYRAQDFSRTGKHGSEFGVYITPGMYVLFQGSTYATRVESEDEVYVIPQIITVGGLQEVSFASFSGRPSQTGSISLALRTRETSVVVSPSGLIGE